MNHEHPDTEQWQAYLRDVESPQYDKLREHLMHCADCRKQVDLISVLQANADTLDLDNHAELDDATEQAIMDYVDSGELADTELEQRLQQDPQALKTALHYASHSYAMAQQDTNATGQAEPQAEPARSGGLSAWFASLFDLRLPVVAVPLTAVGVAALTVTVMTLAPQWQSGDALQLAAYQDNPVIRFSNNDSLPGIGFFTQAGVSSEAFEGVDIRLEQHQAGIVSIAIQWPAVVDASQYRIKLQAFGADGKTVLGEQTTSVNQASFNIALDGSGRRYEWVLTGETADNKSFYTSGGFVIEKPQGRGG